MTSKAIIVEGVEALREEFRVEACKMSHEDLVDFYAKNQASRHYRGLWKKLGITIKVVIGLGGDQSAKIKKFTKEGVDYIHVPEID